METAILYWKAVKEIFRAPELVWVVQRLGKLFFVHKRVKNQLGTLVEKFSFIIKTVSFDQQWSKEISGSKGQKESKENGGQKKKVKKFPISCKINYVPFSGLI